MSQRHFCICLSWFRSTIPITIFFGILLFVPTSIFSQNLEVIFREVTADKDTVITDEYGTSVRPGFPYPVVSFVRVKEKNSQKYIHGLASLERWLGPDDVTRSGDLVKDVWQPILEYHVEDTTHPADNTVSDFMVIERTDLGASIALAMDFSGSMTPEDQYHSKNAAKSMIRKMNDKDRAAIVKFDLPVWVFQDFTGDSTLLIDAVDRDLPQGVQSGTSVYWGIHKAIDLCIAETAQKLKAVVVYTDGGDVMNSYEPAQKDTALDEGDVIAYARANDIPVFTIFVGDTTYGEPHHKYIPDLHKLEDIARYTNGEFFHAVTSDELEDTYLTIYSHLFGSYIVAHRTTDDLPDSTWRWVDVTVNTYRGTGQGRGKYRAPLIKPNVGITKSVQTDSIQNGDYFALSGEIMTYTLDVVSNGPGDAPNVRIVDVLPDSVTFLDYTVEPEELVSRITHANFSPDSVAWTIYRLETGRFLKITYRARVSPYMPVTTTELVNTALVRCRYDSIPGDNSQSIKVYSRGLPDFQVRCQKPGITASPGHPLTLSAYIRNEGTVDTLNPYSVWLYITGDGFGDQPALIDVFTGPWPGDSLKVEYTWQNPQTGNYQFKAVVDQDNVIHEWFENNNVDSCDVNVGIDTLIVRVSDVWLTGEIRGKTGNFPAPVLSLVNVADQNLRHVPMLANDASWLGLSDMTQMGSSVQTVWQQVLEYRQSNPSHPDNPDVRPGFQLTEIGGVGISVMLAVDYSTGLAAFEEDVLSGLEGFIDGLGPSDWAAILGFGDDVQIMQTFTQNKTQLKSAINNREFTDAGRHLQDGLLAGIGPTRDRGGRNTILLITGGEDAGSTHTPSEVVDEAARAGVPVFIVDLSDEGASEPLRSLCDETGGIYFDLSEGDEIENALDAMYGLHNRYYALAHTSSDTIQDNSWRAVDVTVSAYGWTGQDAGAYRAPLGYLDLGIEKTAQIEGDYIQPTIDTVQYTITLRNLGHRTAFNVPVEDITPSGLTLTSSDLPYGLVAGGRVRWTIDSVAVEEVFTFSYSCVSDTLWADQDTTLVNTVVQLCDLDTVITDNNTASDSVLYRPLSPADVVVNKTGTGTSQTGGVWSILPEDTVVYTLRLVNQGQLNISGITLTDVLPERVDFLGVVPPTPQPQGTDTLRWVIPDTLLSRSRTEIVYTFKCRSYDKLFFHPHEDTLVNIATAEWLDETVPKSHTEWDTVYVTGVQRGSPRIWAAPGIVTVGDSVQVDVMTPVDVTQWDLKIYWENGDTETTFADAFISSTVLDTAVRTPVTPQFGDTRMSTGIGEELLVFVIETTDIWGVSYWSSDTVTVRSLDKFFLNENIFRLSASTMLQMRFMLTSNRHAEIIVYDISGGYVNTVYNGPATAGWNYTSWDGRDENERTMGTGIYIAVLLSGDYQESRKFIVVR